MAVTSSRREMEPRDMTSISSSGWEEAYPLDPIQTSAGSEREYIERILEYQMEGRSEDPSWTVSGLDSAYRVGVGD